MSSLIKKTFQYGHNTVSIETGEIAKQASGAVKIDMDGTTLLVTVVGSSEPTEGDDFLPLVVYYEERMYAAGQIPKGFFKREGKPSERETLISRLIDRPLRPLFPEGFNHEVQIIATVLSVNPEIEPDIVAMLGTSAALMLSGIPFNGPVGAARIGYQNGQYILNPTQSQLKDSELDLVVAGTEDAVLMVESEAKFLSESVMLEAVWSGHQAMQTAIQAIKELTADAGKTKWDFKPPETDEVLAQAVSEVVKDDLTKIFKISKKQERNEALKDLRAILHERFLSKEEENGITVEMIDRIFEKLQKKIVRNQIISGEPRIDGRNTRAVRPISIQTGLLPRTHGSALFTRGETQALAVATLGSESDAQLVENLLINTKERFMLHYNFPPYCTGEIGRLTGPKRREIGHGNLAKRGMKNVLPDKDKFPYVIRVVSEITEANGSTSMATVCSTSLCLMDAGVPIKEPVAGIAMGLVKEEQRFAILTDIMGDEDHLGDMDFKVIGTANGVTALQMDIKISGITRFIMERALEQAKEGRLYILGKMSDIISRPREQLSQYAPIMKTVQIDKEKIRDVIGKGGATIRGIIEETGATIDIDDDGNVNIAAPNQKASDAALKRIKDITAEVEVGQIYTGKIVKIMEFGAFVNLLPDKDGFLHISQISEERIERIHDVLQEGQTVTVKVLEIDKIGRVRLSMKASVLED